jgi:hypothetical protein
MICGSEIEQVGYLNSFPQKRGVNGGQLRAASRQIPSKFDLGSQNDKVWIDRVSHLTAIADEAEGRESQ